jgi:hypothetical protein
MVSPSGSRLRRWVLGAVLAVELGAAITLVVADVVDGTPSGVDVAADRELVQQLHLTGIALWSDASYCRQPALAEPVAAHDVHPGAMDLLPAGSLVPARRWGGAEGLP